MKDKFNLTIEQNKKIVIDNLPEIIFNSTELEDFELTIKQITDIIKTGGYHNISYESLIATKNILSSWDYILENINSSISVYTFQDIHEIIGDEIIIGNGNMRSTEVRISRCSYIPPKPSYFETIDIIQGIANNTSLSITERAITLMLTLMKTQYFRDGNKRTSTFLANLMMLQNGKGIITIPGNKTDYFSEILVGYYETDNMDLVKNFIYEECIIG